MALLAIMMYFPARNIYNKLNVFNAQGLKQKLTNRHIVFGFFMPLQGTYVIFSIVAFILTVATIFFSLKG